MKRCSLLMVFTCVFSFLLTAQKPTVTTPDTATSTEKQNWIPHEPLTTEEREHRADKTAELEDIRQRYQQYEQKNVSRPTRKLSDGDYLWTEEEAPQPPVQMVAKPKVVEDKSTNTEDLRMEISRNLQLKGEVTTTSRHTSRTPTAYNQERTTLPQETWTTKGLTPVDSVASTRSNTQWAADLESLVKTPTTTTSSAGSILPLEVNFSTVDETVLAQEAQPALEQWLGKLFAQPALALEIRTHAHIGWSNAAADTWSTRRAQAIVRYFVELGIAPERLQARGYGKRTPLSYDQSVVGKQQNERVEVIVLQQ